MAGKTESVHVHKIDARSVIEQYRKKGFVLLEQTAPTIPAQPGFIKLIFSCVDQGNEFREKGDPKFRLL